MSESLSGKQRLILFKLLFSGEEPPQSKIRPELNPAERDQLVRAGLIHLEPRREGRRRFKAVLLTDKAWEWASANLKSELMVSKYSTDALEAVLQRLEAFLKNRSLTLADLFQSTGEATDDASSESHEAQSAAEIGMQPDVYQTADVSARIRNAYLALSHGEYRLAVHIADVKRTVSDIPSPDVDRALLDMQQNSELSLQSIDDPRRITEADHAAAIRILGQERHLIYLEQ